MKNPATVVIGSVRIGADHPPVIAAELSGNHNGSLDRALAIIDAAADAGAHMVKLQTYTADTITLDSDAAGFSVTDEKSLWARRSLHDLYDEAHTPWEWHEVLFERCRARGMVGFSTPFDDTAVDFLEQLDVPCYKIASFENVHLPLIRKVAKTGKPIIMSSGMATVSELAEAVETARDAGCKDLVLLKCTSTYPATPGNTNVRTIPHLGKLFGCQVGLSDHTMGLGTAAAAVACGATFIEKHLTLDRSEGGVDSAFSAEPAELAQLVCETESAWRALGQVAYGPTDAERGSLQFRRSIYVAEDVREGDVFSEKNLRVIRPGLGLHPRYYDVVIGRRASKDAAKGTPMGWDLLG